jgi:hypothetical protein
MMKRLPNYINMGLVFLLSVIITSCRNVGDVSINVHVWEDINSNQIQDSSEINLQGIDIQILYSGTYTLWSRSTTNIEGMVNEFAAGASCDKFLVVISVPRDYWPTTPVLREIHNCEVAEFGLRPYP